MTNHAAVARVLQCLPSESKNKSLKQKAVNQDVLFGPVPVVTVGLSSETLKTSSSSAVYHPLN